MQPSIQDGLVSALDHNASLRVHGVRLLRMDAKERCIELSQVIQDAFTLRDRLAHAMRPSRLIVGYTIDLCRADKFGLATLLTGA